MTAGRVPSKVKTLSFEEKKRMLNKPKDIKKFLDEYVIGQDEAKEALSIAAYNHFKRIFLNNDKPFNEKKFKDLNNVVIEKSNVLLIGGTGSGKTYDISCGNTHPFRGVMIAGCQS